MKNIFLSLLSLSTANITFGMEKDTHVITFINHNLPKITIDFQWLYNIQTKELNEYSHTIKRNNGVSFNLESFSLANKPIIKTFISESITLPIPGEKRYLTHNDVITVTRTNIHVIAINSKNEVLARRLITKKNNPAKE